MTEAQTLPTITHAPMDFSGKVARVSPVADTKPAASLPNLAALWNYLVPKHAVGRTVRRHVDGSLSYRHATKGPRRISARRLAMLGL